MCEKMQIEMSETKEKTSGWPLQHFLTDTKLPPKLQINSMSKGGGRGVQHTH
jgi:hypothetical protein